MAVALASVTAYVVVRNQLRDDVDNSLRNLFEQISIPQGLLLPGAPAGDDVLVLPTGPLGSREGFAQVVRPDGTVVRPRESRFQLPVDQRALEVARGERKAFFSDATIGGVHARVYTAPLSTGDALQAVRPLEEVDNTLRELGFALAADQPRWRRARSLARAPRCARGAHSGQAADRDDRARRPHQGPEPPDPRRRDG